MRSVHGFARIRAAIASALVLLVAQAGWADDPRLTARLDRETAAAIARIVDEARAARVPTEPLVAKALEGASKRAPGPRIVSAVRQHAAAMTDAVELLGPISSESEVVAGAGALLAGVPRDTLARLRAARPGQSIVIPLVVLADLVARKVPAATASSTVLAASRAGARDSDLLRLRERVEHDIQKGAAPATAAAVRGRALLLGIGDGARRERPGPVATPMRGAP